MIEELSKVFSSQQAEPVSAGILGSPRDDDCIEAMDYCNTYGVIGDDDNDCCHGSSCQRIGGPDSYTYYCIPDSDESTPVDDCAPIAQNCDDKKNCCTGLVCTKFSSDLFLCINATSDLEEEEPELEQEGPSELEACASYFDACTKNENCCHGMICTLVEPD